MMQYIAPSAIISVTIFCSAYSFGPNIIVIAWAINLSEVIWNFQPINRVTTVLLPTAYSNKSFEHYGDCGTGYLYIFNGIKQISILPFPCMVCRFYNGYYVLRKYAIISQIIWCKLIGVIGFHQPDYNKNNKIELHTDLTNVVQERVPKYFALCFRQNVLTIWNV